MVELRSYQRKAVDAVKEYWERGGGNGLIDLATGCGKSLVLAALVREIVETYGARALVLTHVKELVEQDVKATLRLWPQCPVGINSAGLGRRDTRAAVLFASIQSVHNLDAAALGPRHLIVIDEAHLVPRSGDGMYLKFLAKMREAVPDLRVVGLTATPYRLDSGRLDEGEGRIFDDVVYSYGIGEGVRDKHLSPLRSLNGAAGQIDASKVGKRGGEFNAGALESAANRGDLVEAAVDDMIARGAERRGWIVFATGLEHCEAVRAALERRGVAVAAVTGDTAKAERDAAIRAFKEQRLRCLVSVGVLTTGFDAPHVDLIALLRPTLSTGLYVQMLGRGTRLAPGKIDCLVLDYSGNVRRHGPVDAIEIGTSGAGGEKPEAVKEETVKAKECPGCRALVSLRVMRCDVCGHQWEAAAPAHDTKADMEAAVMVSEIEARWLTVDGITFAAHTSQAGRLTLRVDYLVGLQVYPEWVLIGAEGFAGQKAARWWRCMTGQVETPVTVDMAMEALTARVIRVDCVALRIRRDGKYWKVSDRLRSDGIAVDEKLQARPAERRAA